MAYVLSSKKKPPKTHRKSKRSIQVHSSRKNNKEDTSNNFIKLTTKDKPKGFSTESEAKMMIRSTVSISKKSTKEEKTKPCYPQPDFQMYWISCKQGK